jgi:Anti-sigma factor NepR
MRSERNQKFPADDPAVGSHHAAKRDGEVRPDLVCDSAIGRTLRTQYRALTEEPLPERFLSLLSTLQARDARHEK